MRYEDKTKEQFATELAEMHEKLVELEANVTGHRQGEQALAVITSRIERAKQEWEATVDSLSELICLLDDEGRIVRANRTLEHWGLGQVTEIKGTLVQELFRVNLESFWPTIWAKLAQGQPAEGEIRDQRLKRYLNLQVQLISIREKHKVGDSSAVLIVQDITERKAAEEALCQYNAELKARNEELDTFAHTVAHDLQHQLVTIIGFASTLRDHHATMNATEMEEFLHIIAQNGHKMSNILEELLLLAGVRKADIKLEPLDMASIVAEAQNRLVYLIEERQGEIIVPRTWPIALGYAPWIEEVWTNYLSNGLKYGGHPPCLQLGAAMQGDGKVRFWVKDNGPGFPPEAQTRLFTPFTRLDQVRAQGHGLGLSIVRRIVEKLGGQVGAERARPPDRGSIFSFKLPGASR